MSSTKLILFELNEVPRRILDEFCERHPKSTFAALKNEAVEYETYTEDAGHLSPWITWPTLHRGVTNSRHTIAHLGQHTTEIDAEFPSIWNILATEGISVGIGGSLFSYPPPVEPGRFAYYLPDTFAPGPEAFPDELLAFQRFNLAMVSRSARNVDTSLGLSAARGMTYALPRLGITGRTVKEVATQILSERLRPSLKVRRRTVQATLGFDVVMRQLRRSRPDFATFFTNHVAAAMHRFWAALYPGDFVDLGYGQDWISTFDDEIMAAMTEADYFVRCLKGFVDSDPAYRLIVASSMGQGASDGTPCESDLSITDFGKFMRAIGLPPGSWKRLPAMSPDYSIGSVPSELCAGAVAGLNAIRLGPEQSKIVVDAQSDGIHFSIVGAYPAGMDLQITIGNRTMPALDVGISVIPTDFQQGCTGYHIPQGILLLYGRGLRATRGAVSQVSTCDIAPSILDYFGVTRPAYMHGAALI